MYVCSDESVWNPGPGNRNIRFARRRSELFSKWYEDWQAVGAMSAEKIDSELYGEIYCSCFFRSENPYGNEIRDTINTVVLGKQP